MRRLFLPEKSKGMADKAEKDLDLASDCGWVRGLDANGDPIKINMADMVELIRANMPVATSDINGLMSISDKNNLRTINISYNYSKAINLGKVNGLIRFRLWSATNIMGLYLISAFQKTVTYVAGCNISDVEYSFSFDASDNLILECLADDGRTTHFLGLAEYVV